MSHGSEVALDHHLTTGVWCLTAHEWRSYLSCNKPHSSSNRQPLTSFAAFEQAVLHVPCHLHLLMHLCPLLFLWPFKPPKTNWCAPDCMHFLLQFCLQPEMPCT